MQETMYTTKRNETLLNQTAQQRTPESQYNSDCDICTIQFWFIWIHLWHRCTGRNHTLGFSHLSTSRSKLYPDTCLTKVGSWRLPVDKCHFFVFCVKVVKIEKKGGNQAMEWSWTSICKAADPLQSPWKWIFMDFHGLYSIFTSSSVTTSCRQLVTQSMKIY